MSKKKKEAEYHNTASVSEHPKIAEINAAIRQGWFQSKVVKAFGVSRQSISRYCRNTLGIRDYPRYQEKTKKGLAELSMMPCSDYFVRWPGESVPAQVSARADICVFQVEYAPARVPWLTRPTPAPYPFDSVSMPEIETEIKAQKAVEAQEKAAFEAQAALAASFDPVADPPEVETAPEQIQITPRQTAPASPTAPADPTLTSWLNYFRRR